jgi:glycosyltransferase involved in cell wall biosynthesis
VPAQPPNPPTAAALPPRGSVIVPTWNVEPYLRECLDSVLEQTLHGLELIAVDDGSTDASGTILDEYAARDPRVHVIHQPNSGGPGRPRNIGLDHATGDYVFFLDADDYLGLEALERLVAMADRNGSDVVLARMVGLDGRVVPCGAFHEDLDDAPLDLVYGTLNVLKLFRRSHLERLHLRFREDLYSGEDAPFTQRAYLEASVISVLASYDAYYAGPGARRSGRTPSRSSRGSTASRGASRRSPRVGARARTAPE